MKHFVLEDSEEGEIMYQADFDDELANEQEDDTMFAIVHEMEYPKEVKLPVDTQLSLCFSNVHMRFLDYYEVGK